MKYIISYKYYSNSRKYSFGFDSNFSVYILNLISNDNAVKSFNILPINLNVLHNYFNVSNKIIFRSVSKFLDISTKLFYSCNSSRLEIL